MIAVKHLYLSFLFDNGWVHLMWEKIVVKVDAPIRFQVEGTCNYMFMGTLGRAMLTGGLK